MNKVQDGAAIEMIDVVKTFSGKRVLDGIRLSIADGKTTVITGASGQGKSVILKHMLGLVRPDTGSVRVWGQDIHRIGKKDRAHLRSQFGVLFQSVALFDSMTVHENVALPMRERRQFTDAEIGRKVAEMLLQVGLSNVEDKYPTQLSGGMKKRVGLARALVLNPRIMFLDEPTTGLDVERSNEMYRLLHHTQQEFGFTAVIISHDVPRIFKLSDYVVLLAEGRIQGCMSPDRFQRSGNPWIRSFVESTMGSIYLSEREEGALNAQ